MSRGNEQMNAATLHAPGTGDVLARGTRRRVDSVITWFGRAPRAGLPPCPARPAEHERPPARDIGIGRADIPRVVRGLPARHRDW